MSVRVVSDRAQIVALLEATVAADPVRHTVLGTIMTILRAGAGDGWCASEPASGAVAARSEQHTPVAVTPGWRRIDVLAADLARLPCVAAISGPIQVADPLAERLAALLGATTRRMATRLFRLDDLAPPDVPGSARPASDDDRGLLRGWFTAFALEARDAAADSTAAVDRALAWGRVWLWSDETGRPVSLAARRAPNAGSARVGPV